MSAWWGRASLLPGHAVVSKRSELDGVGGVKVAWPVYSSLGN